MSEWQDMEPHPDWDEEYTALWREKHRLCEKVRDLRARVQELEAEQEKADEVFQLLRSWAEAYPTGIFPELDEGDWIDISEALATINISLDRVAASNMRHVVTEVAAMLPTPPEDSSDE